MSALTLEQACHLARKAGFAATDGQVSMLSQANSQSDAIDKLLAQTASIDNLPSWHDEYTNTKPSSDEERKARNKLRREQGKELKFWWFNQMVNNSAPLQEKMTLFWTNHFTSSLKKVKVPHLLLQQNLLLRSHALGSFRDLLTQIIKDPAMLVYLDNASSRKGAPNENFARELLELFTLGEGNYTETDVIELSRTLTGASINRKTGQYFFKKRWHDSNSKTLFGETGNFTPDDVADLILKQPSAGSFIAEKLWRFFINDAPVESEIAQLGKTFADNDYSISFLLNALFNRPEFWASQGLAIKSPMELMVGTIQLFELGVSNQRKVLSAATSMGQNLFDPPNVKGWPGGRAWYSTATLATRDQTVAWLTKSSPEAKTISQMLATNSIGQLPDENHSQYLLQVLHDPAYQVV